ncbi:MAG: OmpA family protein [Verrucomicrobiales bacterium]|nr:OmpA family protein [Verrucomicrobiales bacterium]
MKTAILTAAVIAGVIPAYSQVVEVNPVDSSKPLPVAADVEVRGVSNDTLSVLNDIRRLAPEREAEVQAALKLESEAEANLILDTILADVRDDKKESVVERLRLEEVNRTEEERREYVEYMTRRLQGSVTVEDAPESFRTRVQVEADPTVVVRQPRYYGPGRRVVTYRTLDEVPPVLRASGRLNRVEVTEINGRPFRDDLVAVGDMPESYLQPNAYAVTYVVDPNTEITRSDILFEQGTTNFADAYSYDIVVDLAMAMKNPALSGRSFIIEGHASAEGDYVSNLGLSQRRAERIARELIRYGVPRASLVPVGYGESEATYPSDAAENLRAIDRRVSVFTLSR